MKFLLRSGIILILLLICGTCFSDNRDFVAPLPIWVIPRVLPETTDIPFREIREGVYDLLVDVQVRIPAVQEPAFYHHMGLHIINETGVQANSQINIEFNPDYQKVWLHELIVWRNGEKLSRLETARITVLHRETEAEYLVYSGTRTLNIILEDIRVGDTIEYAYSRNGSNPVYQNVFSHYYFLNYTRPLNELFIRILWEKEGSLFYRILKSDVDLEQRRVPQGVEYRLELRDVPAVVLEPKAPEWFLPWGILYVSEFNEWAQVVEWGTPLFNGAIQSGTEIAEISVRIAEEHVTKKEQVAAALRFVQNEIRYLAIAIGDNTHKPFNAGQVLDRRYGDCKDKTVLLLSILQSMGIQCRPALVNTSLEREIQFQLPSINAFDHVIAWVQLEGETLWLDPTRQFQYGRVENIYQHDYGFALVLGPEFSSLIPMDTKKSPYGVKVFEKYDLTGGVESTAVFTVRTENIGRNAENQRETFAYSGVSKIQDSYLEFYRNYYPGIQVDNELELIDDREGNVHISLEKYQVMNFWEMEKPGRRMNASFHADTVSSFLEKPQRTSRQHPLALGYFEDVRQEIKIILGGKGWVIPNTKFVEDNEFFKFENLVRFDPKTNEITLVYRYFNKTTYVPPEKISDYLDAMERCENNLSYGVYQETGVLDGGFFSWQSIGWLKGIIALYTLVFLAIPICWIVESRLNKYGEGSLFYPISLPRLTFMWFITFGFYGIYYFSKNWKYVKRVENSAIMPWARGLFNPIWYYPFYLSLKRFCNGSPEAVHLPRNWSVCLYAILFLVVAIVAQEGQWPLFGLVASVILVYPLANFINYLNRNRPDILIINSRWRPSQVLLGILIVPVFVLLAASETGIIPTGEIIKGDRIMNHDLRFMQRSGIIKPGEKIVYFYSSAFLFMRNEGNGFTDRHVFSYWKESDGFLNVRIAEYDEIKDIQVTESTSWLEETAINILLKDGLDFVIYASNSKEKSEEFADSLVSRWKKANPPEERRATILI